MAKLSYCSLLQRRIFSCFAHIPVWLSYVHLSECPDSTSTWHAYCFQIQEDLWLFFLKDSASSWSKFAFVFEIMCLYPPNCLIPKNFTNIGLLNFQKIFLPFSCTFCVTPGHLGTCCLLLSTSNQHNVIPKINLHVFR